MHNTIDTTCTIQQIQHVQCNRYNMYNTIDTTCTVQSIQHVQYNIYIMYNTTCTIQQIHKYNTIDTISTIQYIQHVQYNRYNMHNTIDTACTIQYNLTYLYQEQHDRCHQWNKNCLHSGAPEFTLFFLWGSCYLNRLWINCHHCLLFYVMRGSVGFSSRNNYIHYD